MLIGRRGLYKEENHAVWGKVLAGALIAFFPLYGLDDMLPRFIDNRAILTPLSLIVSSLHKFAFMLVLMSGLIFAYYKTGMRHRLMVLAPYGRMSLTNYITQSIIGSMLFYHWGFGLYQHLGITAIQRLGKGQGHGCIGKGGDGKAGTAHGHAQLTLSL